MPDDLNPYLWCTYVDTVSVSDFEVFYAAAYQHPALFPRTLAGDWVSSYTRNGH